MPTPPEERPEHDLINRAIDGDAAAYGALYDQYLTPIYTFIYFQVSDVIEAEDLTEVVFLKAYEKLPEFRRAKKMVNFRAWLYRIARNLVIDHYRTRKPTAPLEPDMPLQDNKPLPERLVLTGEDVQELKSALTQLDELYRQVILLRFISGYSYPEVADMLDITENYVRVIQFRALRKLRTILDPESDK